MRFPALLSGSLLLLFAVTMTSVLGIKTPLDASVFSAAAGAFLLASCAEYPFSIDHLRRIRLKASVNSIGVAGAGVGGSQAYSS